MKKILSLILCAVMLLPCFAGCSQPPEFSEIEGRFAELIEAAYEINEIFFGKGLPVYEHVYDPRNTTDVAEMADGSKVWYYRIEDKAIGLVVAYRSSYLDPFSYVQVFDEPDGIREPIYTDEENSVYAYAISYEEKLAEYYYTDNDPFDYDYVTPKSKYLSISAMKEAAEKVYSKGYLESLYEPLFEGTISDQENVSGMSARYMEYADDFGGVSLMMSNTYRPLVQERRLFDLSTAQIVSPKRKTYVTISVESYLESSPERRETVKVAMILQDGVWMLDSGTY